MEQEEFVLEKISKLIRKMFWVPFVLGYIGYTCIPTPEGGAALDYATGLYAAVALYFVNPITDYQNAVILVAEMLAVLVTTSFLLSVLSKVFRSLDQWFKRLYSDSTAIYADEDSAWADILEKTLAHGYIGKSYDDDVVEKTKDHIIMFDDDIKNLSFYNKHKAELAGSRVYIMLNHVDSFLLGEDGVENVHYFGVCDLIARTYWKKNNLYDVINNRDNSEPYKIAIAGSNDIRKSLFKYGYLNNIYCLHQNIEYHIWGCEPYEIDFLRTLKCDNEGNYDNNDSIIVHEGDYKKDVSILATMDRVILTEDDSMPIMQELLYRNPSIQIHCYNSKDISFTKLYMSNNLFVFGNVTDLLTESNIKEENLYKQAKLVNYDYVIRYSDSQKCPPDYEPRMEKEWRKLNGFLKGSNIARADFYWIEKRKVDEHADEETVWRMEHLRWSRYHFYNRWEYAPKRNNAEHKHNLLVDFDNLPSSEKVKDGIFDDTMREKIEELI